MKYLEWNKEVTYIFEYEGLEFREYIYSNGIDGKRYNAFLDRLDGNNIGTTNQKSTGANNEEIRPLLVGQSREEDMEGGISVNLLYFLPDINEHIYATGFIYNNENGDREISLYYSL